MRNLLCAFAWEPSFPDPPDTPSPVYLWETATGKTHEGFEELGSRGYAAVFSPGGRTLAFLGADHRLRLEEIVPHGHGCRFQAEPGEVIGIGFSADGRALVSGNRDGTVSLWETVSGRRRWRFKGHPGEVTSVAFSPDGSLVASGSADGTVLVWSLGWSVGAALRRQARIGRAELDAAWSDLAGAGGTAIHRAMDILVNAGDKAVVFLGARLRPVRLDRERLRRLIADLDSNRYAVRVQATAAIGWVDWRNRICEPSWREVLLWRWSAGWNESWRTCGRPSRLGSHYGPCGRWKCWNTWAPRRLAS